MSGLFVFVEILKISVGQRATDKWFKYVNYLGGRVGMMLIIKLLNFDVSRAVSQCDVGALF